QPSEGSRLRCFRGKQPVNFKLWQFPRHSRQAIKTTWEGTSLMKALVKSKREPGLWLDEIEVPKIGINDVWIRVHRTGICGTDLHIYRWDDWAQKTIPVPMVVGHEFVGEVLRVGSNVTDFFPGE